MLSRVVESSINNRMKIAEDNLELRNCGRAAGSDLWAGCHQKVRRDDQGQTRGQGRSFHRRSPLLGSTVSSIETARFTGKNARRFGVSTLSNPLVGIHADGAVQTYNQLFSLGPEGDATFARYEATRRQLKPPMGGSGSFRPGSSSIEATRSPDYRLSSDTRKVSYENVQ